MHFPHDYRSSGDEAENGKDESDLSNYPIRLHLWDVWRRVYLERSMVPTKRRTIKPTKIGAKSKRNERGYGLENYGLAEAEERTRTIQYPVTLL